VDMKTKRGFITLEAKNDFHLSERSLANRASTDCKSHEANKKLFCNSSKLDCT